MKDRTVLGSAVLQRHGQEADHYTDGTTTVRGRCTVLGVPHEVTVPTGGFLRWLAGDLAQDALPGVSRDDREFLISGTSPAGWRELFGEDEDEEGGAA